MVDSLSGHGKTVNVHLGIALNLEWLDCRLELVHLIGACCCVDGLSAGEARGLGRILTRLLSRACVSVSYVMNVHLTYQRFRLYIRQMCTVLRA